MGVLATDDFNRADNADLGANWTPLETSFKVSSNTAKASADGSDAVEIYTGVVWPNDQYAQVKVVGAGNVGPTDSGYGVVLRATANNYYRFTVSRDATNNFTVAEVVGGGFSSLARTTVTYVDGAVLYAEVRGTTIKAFYNGAQVGTDITDASHASGSVGLMYSSSTPLEAIDDFEGGDFAVASTGLAWIRA